METGFKFYVDEGLKHIVISPTVTTLSVQVDLYKALKQWYSTLNNSRYAFPIRTIGGDDTVAGQKAGDIYFMINGYRVVYDPTKVQVTGVLFSDDYDTPWLDLYTLKPVYPAQVASLVNVAQPSLEGLDFPTAAQNAQAVMDFPVANLVDVNSFGYHVIDHLHELHYEQSVWIDVNGGEAGTAHPIGTRERPVNNLTDAILIANDVNVTVLRVVEDLTIGATENLDGFTIYGAHASKSQITLTPGCSTKLTQFYECVLTGTADGEIIVRNSVVNDLLGFEGILHQVAIDGMIQFAGAGTKATHILDCFSGVPGSVPEFDFNNLDIPLAFRNYNGGIKLVNKSGASDVSIDLNSGQVILNGTVTNGTIVVRGVGKIVDTSVGATVDSEYLIQGSDIKIINKILRNRTETDPVSGVMTVYDDDGITVLFTANIWENVAATTPYAGNAVNRRDRLT
jgi:hypothetical protein